MKRSITIVAILVGMAQASADPALDRVKVIEPHGFHRHAPVTPEWFARVDGVEVERDLRGG